MISEDFISNLKNYIDIEELISEYIDLKRAGKNKVGKCPFHNEKTPSMVVYGDTQSFYCFGCGLGGDIITFIKNIENLDYPQAIAFLAKKANLEIPQDVKNDKKYILKNKILKINLLAARFFYQNLIKSPSNQIWAYLNSRQLEPKYIKKFGLGFANDNWFEITNYLKSYGFNYEEILASNLAFKSKKGFLFDNFRNRLIIPIIDITGNIIAFGGRIINDNQSEPKYLNSSDTLAFKKSHSLFALNFCKNSKQDYIILTEGYMDVISLYQAGFDNAVASLGTSLTFQQARLLSSYTNKVIIAYDADNAGQKAASRAIDILKNTGLNSKILDINGAKDPDEFIRKFGKSKFLNLINKSQNIFDFKLNKLKLKNDLSLDEGKINFFKDIIKELSLIYNPIEREVYISKIANEFDINREILSSQVNRLIKKEIIKNKKVQALSTNKIIFNNTSSNTTENTKNSKIIFAENKILTILLKNPDFYLFVKDLLSINDFSDPINQNIYQLLIDRLSNSLSIDLINLSNISNEATIKKIAFLFASDLNINFNKDDLFNYISTIKDFNIFNKKNFSQMNVLQLKAYFDNLKTKKNKF